MALASRPALLLQLPVKRSQPLCRFKSNLTGKFLVHSVLISPAPINTDGTIADINGVLPDPSLHRSNNTTEGKRICLFYSEDMADLASKVAESSEGVELRPITWGQFPDGFPNLFVPRATSLRGRHVALLASFHSPTVLFEQLSIAYTLPRLFVSSLTLLLPFLPPSPPPTPVVGPNYVEGGFVPAAATLARALSAIPLSRGGPCTLLTFDSHGYVSGQESGLGFEERALSFGDNVQPWFQSAAPLLKQTLLSLADSANISIAFPSESAYEKFHTYFSHYPIILCTKIRDGHDWTIEIKSGFPSGRHVVIVDDIVRSGSTLIECRKLLSLAGATKISAYVTHAAFLLGSWERFLSGTREDEFANFWMTDSCPVVSRQLEGVEPFQVLSLAPLIQLALAS